MIKKNSLFFSCLLVAMALGTAWAVRGKFGHEQGAAWAGAIGAMSIVLVARRQDWYDRVFKIALVAAFGWGIGGMISYGVVVGYARAGDFANVYYGLVMLFVIGALYGFLGGGLFGFALADTKESKIPWSLLIAEMVAFGVLTYGFLINQLEWLMTPPRSELWAACLGACIPLAWRAIRCKQQAVIRVTVWSAFGAGFGFAFGNFLQVTRRSTGLPFNFWNVMEYSIGFFGGLGMSYATLTSSWPILEKQSKRTDLMPAILLFVFIPFVVWDQSFPASRLHFIFDRGGDEQTIQLFQWIAISAIGVAAVMIFKNYLKNDCRYADVRNIFLLYLGVYILMSFLRTGIFSHPVEQYLYLVNLAIILFGASRITSNSSIRNDRPVTWIVVTLCLLIVFVLLTWMAIQFNVEPLKNKGRF